MKEDRSIYIYLLSYMTLCGALFHISFWDKFNINGLSFISISDILKSSIYPVFSILFSVIYNLTIQNLILPSTADDRVKFFFKKSITNSLLLFYYSIASGLLILILYFTKTSQDPINSFWYGLINGLFASIFLISNNFFEGYFSSERMRRLIIDLIVFIPIVSFYTGKYKSELIYQNIQYKYVVNSKKDQSINQNTRFDTLKFIGNTEKHFVFTDLKNSKIIFIKSDVVDTLTLYVKK